MQGRTKILVVDDEHVIALTLSTILEHEGYDTATAYSGEEAIVAASTFRPDFLLSDIAMGGMNGIEAAIKILNILPSCKVLFVSGHAACLDLLGHARERGFDFEILNKPVYPSELLKKISQALCFQQTSSAADMPRKTSPSPAYLAQAKVCA